MLPTTVCMHLSIVLAYIHIDVRKNYMWIHKAQGYYVTYHSMHAFVYSSCAHTCTYTCTQELHVDTQSTGSNFDKVGIYLPNPVQCSAQDI